MNHVRLKLVAGLVTGLVCCTAAYAGKTLPAAEIQSLIAGKTADGENLVQNYKFKVYFDKNGDLVQKTESGEIKEGRWQIDAEGMHCVDFGAGDRCAAVEDIGNGTYARVTRSGKTVVKWRNFIDGKGF